MVQSVELLLDDDLDAVVRGQWRALADTGEFARGLPDPESHRPHVTMTVADEFYPRVEKTLLRGDWFEPVPLRLGGLVVFPARQCVLARLVVPSPELLALHSRLARLTRGCPGQGSHVAPGHWTPHVTLGRRLFPDEVAAALKILNRQRDRSGHASGARRWDGENRREWLVAPGVSTG